ncbi:anaerobic ribonucleoside-triphosphate reductase activating protein [Gemmatimonadota bacterium]
MEHSAQLRMANVRTELSPVYALLKKPSLIDYPGRMCRVLFISGCNMQCFFCHNTDLIKASDSFIEWDRLEQTLLASREQWVDSVCISGGEPTLHPKLFELIGRIRRLGFRIKLDTNGSVPDVLRHALPLVDYVAMDYKAPLERYAEITGCHALEPERIIESVRLISCSDIEHEFRTTVVEGWHSEEDMHQICRELSGAKRFRIQGYVPARHGTPLAGDSPVRRTPMKTLRKFETICREYFPETYIRGG